MAEQSQNNRRYGIIRKGLEVFLAGALALGVAGCPGGGGGGGGGNKPDTTLPILESVVIGDSYKEDGQTTTVRATDNKGVKKVLHKQRVKGTEAWTEWEMPYIGGDTWKETNYPDSEEHENQIEIRDEAGNTAKSQIISSKVYVNETGARNIIAAEVKDSKEQGEIIEYFEGPIVEVENEEIPVDVSLINLEGGYTIIDYKGQIPEDYAHKKEKFSRAGLIYVLIGPRTRSELTDIVNTIRENRYPGGDY